MSVRQHRRGPPLYDVRRRATVERFRFQRLEGDLLLPWVFPVAVADRAAEHRSPSPAPTRDELDEALCEASAGAEGHGCPAELAAWLRAGGVTVHPLSGISGAGPRVRWRDSELAVTVALSDFETRLASLHDPRYAQAKRAQILAALGPGLIVDVSSWTHESRRGTQFVRHDPWMDLVVAEILESGRAEVHVCGGPTTVALWRAEAHDDCEAGVHFSVPDGPSIGGPTDRITTPRRG